MNILVSGGSSGIGKELVSCFANDGSNHVFTFGRSDLPSDVFGSNVEYFSFDLLEYKEKHCLLIDRIRLFFGGEGIDVIVNNAGCLTAKGFDDITYTDLEAVFAINFFSAVGMLQDLKCMLGRNERATHVVNIGSMGGFQGSVKFPGLLVYSASKAALASLTESLAVEWAEDNIRVNCLSLGAVDTSMLHTAFPGVKASVSAGEMARYIADFALNSHLFFNGKIIPVSSTTP